MLMYLQVLAGVALRSSPDFQEEEAAFIKDVSDFGEVLRIVIRAIEKPKE